MIDFSTLKGLSIPEGVVTQIADASGAVLWSAKRNAIVTITSKCEGIVGNKASITIASNEPFAPDSTKPNDTVTTWTAECWEEPNCTIELPRGATIECTVSDSKQSNRCYVMVNGVEVLGDPGTYSYTVKGNVAVHVADRYDMGEYGMITITEQGG